MGYKKFAAVTVCALLAALLIAPLPSLAVGSATVSTNAKAAILYAPQPQSIIYAKGENARLPMASTTKIMTAIIVAENTTGDEIIAIPEDAVGVEGSSAYLKSGDLYTVEELLYALMLSSANDAAVALAYHVSGGIDEFVALMNERAEAMGLLNTHFANPHGLDDKEHYTTAYELAIIASHALDNDTVRTVASTYKKSFVTEDRKRIYVNHNKLLRSFDGSIGMKTGYTTKSGRCLVSATERDGILLICVTLDDPSDWKDHKALCELGFSRLERIDLIQSGQISRTLPVLSGVKDTVTVENDVGASVITEKTDARIDIQIRLPRFLCAPIKSGETIGYADILIDGKRVASQPLVAKEEIKIKRGSDFLSRLLGKGNG